LTVDELLASDLTLSDDNDDDEGAPCVKKKKQFSAYRTQWLLITVMSLTVTMVH